MKNILKINYNHVPKNKQRVKNKKEKKRKSAKRKLKRNSEK